MDKKTLLEQAAYHDWATRKIIQAVQQLSQAELEKNLGGSFASLWATLMHMYSAEEIWLSRWQGDRNAGFRDADAFANLEQLQAAWQDLRERTVAFIQQTDINAVMDIRGHQHQLWQLVLHMIDHSSFHRGQVAHMLRALGHVPPSTNLIHYLRENP